MTRIAIIVGIAFLMVQKPALLTSVLTIILAAAAGAVGGLIGGRRAPSASAIGSAAAQRQATNARPTRPGRRDRHDTV